MGWLMNWYKHPYINYENYELEYEEWEKNPKKTDRTGRHHVTFGCSWDWRERKYREWENNPRAALKDAIFQANKTGEEVWMRDELEKLVDNYAYSEA